MFISFRDTSFANNNGSTWFLRNMMSSAHSMNRISGAIAIRWFYILLNLSGVHTTKECRSLEPQVSVSQV